MIQRTVYDITLLNPEFQDLSLGCHIVARHQNFFFQKKLKKKNFFLSRYVVFGTPIYVDVHELAIFAPLTFFPGNWRHVTSCHVKFPLGVWIQILVEFREHEFRKFSEIFSKSEFGFCENFSKSEFMKFREIFKVWIQGKKWNFSKGLNSDFGKNFHKFRRESPRGFIRKFCEFFRGWIRILEKFQREWIQKKVQGKWIRILEKLWKKNKVRKSAIFRHFLEDSTMSTWGREIKFFMDRRGIMW